MSFIFDLLKDIIGSSKLLAIIIISIIVVYPVFLTYLIYFIKRSKKDFHPQNIKEEFTENRKLEDNPQEEEHKNDKLFVDKEPEHEELTLGWFRNIVKKFIDKNILIIFSIIVFIITLLASIVFFITLFGNSKYPPYTSLLKTASVITVLENEEIEAVSSDDPWLPTNTVSPDGAQTEISTKTPTFTPTPPLTHTPTLTETPTPTPTKIYSYVRVGIFDNGNDCYKTENLDKLDEIGFEVEKIKFDIPYKDMILFDIVYFSTGWCCQQDMIEKGDFQTKMDDYIRLGRGILVGDPNPPNKEVRCKIDFLNIDYEYQILNQITSFNSYDVCKYSTIDCKTHWLIYKTDLKDLPIPESEIRPVYFGDYSILAKNYNSHFPSIVIGKRIQSRWLLLPGSEPSSTQKPIDNPLFENIILWLAGERPKPGEEEWYEYKR